MAPLNRTCSINGCELKHYGRGWCINHYMLWRKNGSPHINLSPGRGKPARERFWLYVTRGTDDECWNWKGGKKRDGYGNFSDDTHRTLLAHRFAYEMIIGPIPDGLQLDHLCRNRSCVNPAHLEPVTNRENVLRGVSPPAMLAARTHCNNGHPFDLENTYFRTTGGRRCKVCRETYRKAWRAKRREAGLPVI